jgi:hypothetical protein
MNTSTAESPARRNKQIDMSGINKKEIGQSVLQNLIALIPGYGKILRPGSCLTNRNK